MNLKKNKKIRHFQKTLTVVLKALIDIYSRAL
jgi:hypothetical protein